MFQRGLQQLQAAQVSVAVMTRSGRKRDRAVGGWEDLQFQERKPLSGSGGEGRLDRKDGGPAETQGVIPPEGEIPGTD